MHQYATSNNTVHLPEPREGRLGDFCTTDELERRSREEIVLFARMLYERHYVSGCDGNLSVRLAADRILTTPTGMSKVLLTPEQLVMVGEDGRKVGGALQPSSEIQMHLTIYRHRPDVTAVVHAHPFVATGVGCAGLDLTEPICSELVLTLGRIPLAKYAPPGSAELSEALIPFIPSHEAILMQNHGVVTYSDSLSRAYLNMETVEHCARIMVIAKMLGHPTCLNHDQVEHLLELKRDMRVQPCRA